MKRADPVRLAAQEGEAPPSLRVALDAMAQGPTADELAKLQEAVRLAVSEYPAHGGPNAGSRAPLRSTALAKVSVVTLALVVGAASWVWRANTKPLGVTSTRLAPVAAPPTPSVALAPGEPPVPTPRDPGREGATPPPSIDPPSPPVAHVGSGLAQVPVAAPAVTRPAPVSINPPGDTSAPPPPTEGPTELELLARARAVLASRPDEALALARDHESRFPRGRLAQERDVIVIQALRRLGRTAEVASAEKAFRARYPGSPYENQIAAP